MPSCTAVAELALNAGNRSAMGDYRAITAVCEGIVNLLRENVPDDLESGDLEFDVYLANDFTAPPIQSGVSLFLYRVTPNQVHRTPAGRFDTNGRRMRSRLPLDLHFMLTPWAAHHSLQHNLLAWMMRLLEDTPVLPAGYINGRLPGSLRPDEAVELFLEDISNEDLFRLWETLARDTYRLSIPYVARMVMIESNLLADTAEPVHERRFDMREIR